MDNNSQNYNNYQYGEVYNYEVVAPKKKICGLLSFIFGLVIIVFNLCACMSSLFLFIPGLNVIVGFLIGFINIIAPIVVIVGFILGIIGVTRKNCPKGLAIAGLIINIILLLYYLLLIVIAILAALGIVTTGVFAGLSQYLQYNNLLNH